MQRRRNRSHETKKRNNDLFKVAANALGLNKQDNANGTCAADGKLCNANGIKAMNHILILSRSEEGTPKSNAENNSKQT